MSYFLFGASIGFALNLICVVRNLIFYFAGGSPSGLPLLLDFTRRGYNGSGHSVVGGSSLLMIAMLTLNAVIMSVADAQILRKSIILTSTLILIYNVIILSIGGIASEAFSIISSIIVILRFRKERQAI